MLSDINLGIQRSVRWHDGSEIPEELIAWQKARYISESKMKETLDQAERGLRGLRAALKTKRGVGVHSLSTQH